MRLDAELEEQKQKMKDFKLRKEQARTTLSMYKHNSTRLQYISRKACNFNGTPLMDFMNTVQPG